MKCGNHDFDKLKSLYSPKGFNRFLNNIGLRKRYKIFKTISLSVLDELITSDMMQTFTLIYIFKKYKQTRYSDALIHIFAYTHTFQPRITNLTNININKNEINLLNKGNKSFKDVNVTL